MPGAPPLSVFDAHVDSLQLALDCGRDLAVAGAGHLDLERGLAGGLGAAVFVAWVDPAYLATPGAARARAEGLLDELDALCARRPDRVRLARDGRELEAANAAGAVAAVAGIEGAHVFEGDRGALEHFHGRGVRVLTLCWNNHLPWIRSCQPDAGPGVPAGLSAEGRAVVRAMDALGMVVDLSHAGERSFYDALEAGSRPPLASHSGCRALHDHPRNLTDDQLRALAARGGVAGIVFCTPFLDARARADEAAERQTARYRAIAAPNDTELNRLQGEHLQAALPPLPLARVVEHVLHAAEVAGIDHVGVGSDFDGIQRRPAGLEDAGRYGALADALRARGLDEVDVLKVLGGNLRRVFARATACLAGLVLALAAGGCGGAEPARTSALIVTVDTTNPGALDVYGRDRGLTPAVAALARESLVFDRARATAPLTLPSHASMMTGLVPIRHGVRDNGPVPLPAEALTLAERARADGYRTAAFVAARVLASTFGLDQGFEHYDEPPPRGPGEAGMVERPARAVTDAARAWLAARDRSRPFLLWAHYFDPHAPYEPPRAELVRTGGNAYLGEVAVVDREVGRLLDAVRADPGLDRLLVVLVADHGEGLGRHGESSHATLCYDSTIRVPLVVRFPDGRRAGERSDAPASVADVHPTVAGVLGLGGAPGGLDGVDLSGPVPADRGVYFESYSGWLNFGWSPLAGWADARGKYLHSAEPELFDTDADPDESDELLAAGADPARYREALARVAAAPRLSVAAGAQIDEGLAADLRALGYTGAVEAADSLPDPLDPTDRPAPHTRMEELERYYAATGRIVAGDRAGAVAILAEVAAANPRNVQAREHLASQLVVLRRWEEALAVLDELRALGRDRPELREYEAACRRALGR